MTELTLENWNTLVIDTMIKYKDELYKVINKSTSSFGSFIYIEKIPDDGKKYNLCLIKKDNTLIFHVLCHLNITISFSDIEIL
jgi:hypothetical protein